MRNAHADPGDSSSLEAKPGDRPWSHRTAPDLASLLLELARALRGFSFYDEADSRRRPLAERAHRAVQSELSRAGALEIAIGESGFEAPGLDRPIEARGVLAEFQSALFHHGLTRLRIEPSLTRDALHGFLDLLGRTEGRTEGARDFSRKLAARDARGLWLNDIDAAAQAPTQKLSATPPRASISLGTPLFAEDANATTQELECEDGEQADHEKPTLDSDPLGTPASDDRGERLRARLIELDHTSEDRDYAQRASDISVWAKDLWDQDLREECYRALLVLADHAVGGGGRSEGQARVAAACFADLASAGRLEDLIERATDPGYSGVRAAQLLLQLGESGVAALFDRICEEEEPSRRAPLHALMIALGEATLPTLLTAMRDYRDERARLAIRLAGELQNPVVLPTVLAATRAGDLERRIEAIRALSFLPGEASKAALEKALDSELEDICVAATQALAKTEGSDALPALLDVLEATLHSSRTRLGRTLVGVLGQLGDERAVPRLASILERKPLVRRAHWHAIQLAAIDALAVLPTREAQRSIERTTQHGARAVREHARKRLETLLSDD